MAFDYGSYINSKNTSTKLNTSGAQSSFDYGAYLKTSGGGSAGTGGGSVQSSLLSKPGGAQLAAQQAGLGKQAQDIIESKGESPDKIFSGGFISDIFDVLNTLQYGVTGVLQGKGFGQGVATRASFTKEQDLQKLGWGGAFIGLALDIAVDPLTYIAPASALRKLGVLKAAGKAADAAKATKVGGAASDFFGRRFIYRYGQDPLYVAMDEKRIHSVARATENAIELARPIAKLDPEIQKMLLTKNAAGQVIRRSLDDIAEKLSPEQVNAVKAAWSHIDDLGKKLVDLNILPKDVYNQNVNQYIRNVYRKFEAPKALGEKTLTGVFPTKPLRLDLSFLKKRQDLSPEIRDALGQVLEAGYPTADTLLRLSKAVEDASFFREVATKFGTYTAREGFEFLPTTKRLGDLSGMAVPKAIADSINEITRATEKGIAQAIVGGFKYSKVILNPATHARNMMSNMVLNSFEGMNPLDPRVMKIYGKAAAEIKTGGKWYKEAKAAGLGLDTYAANELRGFLAGPEFQKGGSAIVKAGKKLADLYQKEEEWAKLAQYIFQRTKKGLGPDEAWRVAERATFNYAQVTPFIRRLRESLFGFPFITFTYKATPQIVRTAFNAPTRISNIGKIKQAIESQSNQKELAAERATEPDWIKDGFYVKLPMKDKYGRSAYFDLTYIIPFGDLVSGNFFTRGVSRETGLPETPARAYVRNAPLLNFIAEITKNTDFYGNKIVKDSDPIEKQLGDIFRHTVKTYSPPLIADQIPGGYRADGTRRGGTLQTVLEAEAAGKPKPGTSTRTLFEQMMSYVGMKVTPIDLVNQTKYSKLDVEKALEQLLKDNGVIRSFDINYVPKR